MASFAGPPGLYLNRDTYTNRALRAHLVRVPGEFAGSRVFTDAVAVIEAEGIALGEFGRGVDEAAQEEGFDVRIRLRELPCLLDSDGLGGFAAGRGGIKALFGQNQMTDRATRTQHWRLLHVVGQHVQVLHVDDRAVRRLGRVRGRVQEVRIQESLRVRVPGDAVIGVAEVSVQALEQGLRGHGRAALLRPVVVERDEDARVRILGLDRVVEDAEAVRVGLHVRVRVDRAEVVPDRVIDFIADDPVRNAVTVTARELLCHLLRARDALRRQGVELIEVRRWGQSRADRVARLEVVHDAHGDGEVGRVEPVDHRIERAHLLLILQEARVELEGHLLAAELLDVGDHVDVRGTDALLRLRCVVEGQCRRARRKYQRAREHGCGQFLQMK